MNIFDSSPTRHRQLSVSPPPPSFSSNISPSISPKNNMSLPTHVGQSNYSKPSKPFIFYSLVMIVFICIMAYSFIFFNIERGNKYATRIPVKNSDNVLMLWLMDSVNDKTLHTSKSKIMNKSQNLSFLEMDLLKIKSNISNIDPFSLTSGVNVWDLFPPSISCPELTRIGRLGDGGKWICAMSHLEIKNTNKCIVYSFGISTDASFEEELLMRSNCTIYAFDPSIGSLPKPKFLDLALWRDLESSRIRFHKWALSDNSGSSSDHSLTANLFDIMNLYGHSYIDVLKIDVEGAEWSLFDSIASDLSSGKVGLSTLSVGQLVIELHFQSMKKTEKFFNTVESLGFVSFSREINLQPCLAGGKPVAVEYSFINPVNVLLSEKYGESTTFGPSTFHIPRPKSLNLVQPPSGLVYLLSQKSRYDILKYTLTHFYDKVWKPYPFYPIVIFHDDIDDYLQVQLLKAIPNMLLRFIRVNFSLPTQLHEKYVPTRTKCAPKSSTLGYRHMCRFHSTGAHDILFSLKEYESIEYFLRLDDDSLFTGDSPIGYDIFHFMKQNNKKYGFINIVADDPLCVDGLWNATKDFLSNLNASLVNRSSVFFDEWREPNVFYNNFEISHVSVWKNSLWKHFMSYIDNSGGIYTHRWGDAPIHTIGVSLILSKNDVHAFTDIPYRHFPFVDQEASGLPMPSADPFIPKNSQDCKYYSHWSCSGHLSNTSHNSSKYDSVFSFNQLSNSESQAIPRKTFGKSVLYTFAHSNRENILVETLKSFYINFAYYNPTPVVIFFSLKSPVNFEYVRSQVVLPEMYSEQMITFKGVQLKSFRINDEKNCGPLSSDGREVSQFLNSEVYHVLYSNYGYEWFFRFGDDSRLQAPLHYNVFDFLEINNKKYGYINAVREFSKCAQPLWSKVRSLCKDKLLFSLSSGCNEFFNLWPENVVFFSNFEISHISIWNHTNCKTIFDAARPVEFSQNPLYESQSNRTLSSIFFSDAAIHTTCVLTSLNPSEIFRFEDIQYKVNHNVVSNASLVEHKSKLHHSSKSLHSIDNFFYPRRFGWLGGDISASIALPSEDNDKSQYIWLFGDTLIGRSIDTRRSEGILISNSVGIATMQSIKECDSSSFRSLESIRFFWGDDIDGNPMGIFRPEIVKNNTRTLFWPVGGVVIESPNRKTKMASLIVLGQFAQPPKNRKLLSTSISLAFEDLSSALMIITNPFDIPSNWQYETTVFPDTNLGRFKWFAIADSAGNRYADYEGFVYLLGSFTPVSSQNAFSSNSKLSINGFIDIYQVSSLESYQVIGKVVASSLLKGEISTIEVLCQNSDPFIVEWQKIYKNKDHCQPKSVFSPRISEASFHFDFIANEWVIVSLQALDQSIKMCRSGAIHGPWSCQSVFDVPSPWNDPTTYVTYGAKAHPEFVCANNKIHNKNQSDLVISYVPNMLESFLELFRDSHRLAYTPKFEYLYVKE